MKGRRGRGHGGWWIDCWRLMWECRCEGSEGGGVEGM